MISASVLGQSKCDQNGGETDVSRTNYAEIIVIRHGETEWNSDGRIQVFVFSVICICLGVCELGLWLSRDVIKLYNCKLPMK